MKRPLDIEVIKQARANLDRIARENPHMIDHARAKWTEEDIVTMVDSPSKTVYNVNEAADVLNCHPQTLRRAIRSGVLKAARIGKAVSISRFDLEAYYRAKGGGQLFADDALADPENERTI